MKLIGYVILHAIMPILGKRSKQMMDFIVVHRIKLFYISMSLVLLWASYHEAYAYDALLYGVLCMVGIMVGRPYKYFFKTIEHWF